MKKEILIFGIAMILMIGVVSALYVEDSETVDFGHYMRIYNVSSKPSYISPGEESIISFNIKNNGKGAAENIRIKLILPPELKFYEDVDTVKISKLNPLESLGVNFQIIASPDASEGVYNANLTVDYTSFFAADFANVGEDYHDNFVLGIIVKSDPIIFVEVEDSKIYKGQNTGEVTFKFVNNDLADVKFLTVELEESEDYKIISSPREYIGDLDSDDFESIDFKLKAKKTSKDILLPLKISYKDSMNKDYEDRIEASLKMYSAKELGVEKNNATTYLVVIVILGVVGWFVWKRYFKKKKISFKK